MSRLTDEDGVDGPFEKAMAKSIKADTRFKPSTQLVDLVQQLRGHLMELRSPKTKQTAGVVWDTERHERWLKVLDPESPLEQLRQALELLRAAGPQMLPLHENIINSSAINAIGAVIASIEADSKVDAAVAKANRGCSCDSPASSLHDVACSLYVGRAKAGAR